MDENKGTVILKSLNEWRRWLEQLRTKATKERVWDYVNPSPLRTHEVEPAPEKPVKPPFPDSIMPNQNKDPEVEKLALMRFQMELQLYEQHYQRYKDEKARYEKHQERLDAELQEEFALQPEQEHELINERYRDLLTPKRGMKPKDWISKWENLLLDMQLTDFNEIPEKRMSRDFIRSSAFIAPKFAESWTTTLIELDTGLEVLHRKIGLDSVPGIRDMIKIFEQWVKAQRNVMDPTRRDASFAMLGGKSDQPEKEEEQKGTQQSNQQTNHQSRSQQKGQSRNRERTCLCGAKHNFEDCPYVNEGKRSKDWKEDEDITRKFKDVERSNTSLAKALKAVKGKLKLTNSTNKKESDDGKKDNEPERSNFVYDEDEVQISIGPCFERSNMAIQVQTIATATDSDKDLKDAVILDNGTTTNIFNDLRRLRNMGNEERICLVGNGSVKMYGPGETIIYLTNPISRQAKKGILVKEAWYVPGMHTNIISQGMAEEYGLFFNGLTRRLVTKKQDICGLKKEGRLYLIEWDENRKPRSSLGNDLALSSFERKVLKDPGNVWYKRLGHISEQAVEKLQEATEGALVTSPRALGRNEEGFKEKFPNTPEQNGPSERAGGLITTRTRSAIQEANLPTGLWPYVMQAMVYIINRTPTKAIGYKTPYEMAYGKKLTLEICTCLDQRQGPRGTKVIRARDVVFDETKKYNPEHPFAREIIRNGVTKITESLDIPNLEDFNEERVVESVDEYMNLQQSSSMKFPLEIPVLASGNSQTVTTQQHIPESMEINDQPVNEPTQSVVIHSDSHLIPSPSASSSTESMQGHQMSTSKELLLENRISEQNQDDKMEIDDVHGQQDNQLVRFDDTKNEVTLYGDESQFGESGRVTGEDSGEEEAQQDEGAERENMALTAGTTTSPSGQIPQIGNEQTPLLQLTNEESRNPDVTLPELLLSTTPQQRSAPKASEIGADLSEGNIVTGPRRRIPSKRARSPEIATSKAERKRHRAFFARIKLLQESSAYKVFLAAAEKLDGYEPLHEDIPPEPRNWIGVKRHRFARQFEEAGRTEMESLKRKGTFEVVDRPEGKQILPLTWVFKYKSDKFRKIAKFKARICVRGDLQKGMDLETRAATLAARIFRMMMALAAVFDLEIVQLDAVNAFVNSDLDEEVYVYFLDGFRIPGKVIRLRKALYGLRQSPRLWQKELTGTLLELGFSQIPDEECLFVKDGVFLLFFVDDILIFYDRKNRQSLFEEIVKKLTSKYEIRQMEKFEWFLNIRIVRDRKQRKIWICQDLYITKIAKKFGLTQNNTKTPISIDLQPSESEAMNEDIHLYQELVGSAMYAAVMTRPDVTKPVNELAKFTTNPSKDHIRQIKRVIEYLYNTQFLAIEFSPPENSDSDVAICASDASFGDNADRTSSEAYIFSLYGGPVDWRATKQRLVTTSTTEAELRAATEAAMKLYVWKRVFKAIGFKTDRELSIQCDNKQTVLLLTREDPHFRTNLQHIDIYHYWLRQEVRCGRLHIEWVPTKEMIADGLTKVLKGQQFLDWRKHQGLTDIAHLVQE
ncbi:reverse transcriptase family protein [Talaromyces stipitatus ATCC 10500]|uniref:Reverse transcriptase family protein n=1 Tax=Talaromyces stipitatus (strain ATCC 10500 / CBS 375.48 / QM 6759 / NRRL 1006) TaxID=441959 RepID=B8MJ45_TALSN|nr:reverse transcriptase family protein [Talaromyces stipitatus ATCC 10500]EED15707.1 reverse transcriptase family protein [Talaromyces stipitatus ATCC 10500]